MIIANYNGISILKDCLISLLEQHRKPDQIIVVDNGSSDNSPAIIKKEFPGVTLVALDKNTGFTGANNAGLQVATGNFLVLLNNDCIVEPGWLEHLLLRMEDPSVAAVSSSMRKIDDLKVIDSAGGQIDWMGFSKDIGKDEPASLHDKTASIPFPCGGAVMLRRKALSCSSRIFWNDLFLYHEDMDLGLELLRTGWKIVYEPTAVVRHIHSATAGSGNFLKEYHCIRNRILVMRKHFDNETFLQMRPVIKKWQNLWMLKSLASGKMFQVKAILKGTSHGLNMPVTQFRADVPVNDIFVRFARHNSTASGVKRKMCAEMEQIIRSGSSNEKNNE